MQLKTHHILLGSECWVLKLRPDFVAIIGEGSHGTQPWRKMTHLLEKCNADIVLSNDFSHHLQ